MDPRAVFASVRTRVKGVMIAEGKIPVEEDGAREVED